eukprot:gene37978-46863_t
MVLGDVEESVTVREVDEETEEEIIKLCTSDELKAMEKDIRNTVQDSLTAAKS